jgi:18S rRNA (guanine1575-N7)-methyltransferase
LQAYPENSQQMELLAAAALRSGFGGGWLIDFPNSTRAKKFYLVIWAGASSFAGTRHEMPAALDGEEPGSVEYEQARMRMMERRAQKSRKAVKGRDWVMEKKERQRRQGREVRPDSKYTGRKRKHWQ